MEDAFGMADVQALRCTVLPPVADLAARGSDHREAMAERLSVTSSSGRLSPLIGFLGGVGAA